MLWPNLSFKSVLVATKVNSGHCLELSSCVERPLMSRVCAHGQDVYEKVEFVVGHLK